MTESSAALCCHLFSTLAGSLPSNSFQEQQEKIHLHIHLTGQIPPRSMCGQSPRCKGSRTICHEEECKKRSHPLPASAAFAWGPSCLFQYFFSPLASLWPPLSGSCMTCTAGTRSSQGPHSQRFAGLLEQDVAWRHW